MIIGVVVVDCASVKGHKKQNVISLSMYRADFVGVE